MSFIGKVEQGYGYQPGWFLAHEDCHRITMLFKADGTTADVKDSPNGGKYIPMGSVYKSGGVALGLVYEDVDVTKGDMPGSVVTFGVVYEERCAVGAKTALNAVTGIKWESEPKIERATVAPTISTSSSLTNGGTSLVLDADRAFAKGATESDFDIDYGTSGITWSGISVADKKATITLNAASAGGTVTVTALDSAFEEAYNNSNTLSLAASASEAA